MCIVLVISMVAGYIVLSQRWWPHRHTYKAIEQKSLSEVLCKKELSQTDYDLILSQTGLGSVLVKELLSKKGGKDKIIKQQQLFLQSRKQVCTSLLGWLTCEDQLVDDKGESALAPPFLSLLPGDILITLSTHSLGWSHGHAALVLDSETLLESRLMGEPSGTADVDDWRSYSDYAVLRVKNRNSDFAESVANYSRKHLTDIPYRLRAGLIGEKFMDSDSEDFGLQCGYLVWYAWKAFGVDLDSTGRRLVTPRDLLLSEKVELVQVYGMTAERLNL